jgi:hypothetical protein
LVTTSPRAAAKLTDELETLHTRATLARGSAIQWAVRARARRRAADLKIAIQAAGSVYLASRLVDVRTALRNFDLALNWRPKCRLASRRRTWDPGSPAHTARRARRPANADRRIRQVQSTLATPDLRAWRDLDTLVASLENRCRGLHARYVRERTALVALCDRLVANAPAAASPKRKVG